MPIYGFECGQCGHQFDRLQKLSDPDPTQCPACAAASIRRQLTAPVFRLAGSGWYETDFKKDGDKKRNLAGDDSAGKSEPAKPDASTKPDAPSKAEMTPAASKESKSAASASAPTSAPGSSSS